jgi:hypothetical protein
MKRVPSSPPKPAGLIEAMRGRANFGTPVLWPGTTGPIATRFINGNERLGDSRARPGHLQLAQGTGHQGGEWRS